MTIILYYYRNETLLFTLLQPGIKSKLLSKAYMVWFLKISTTSDHSVLAKACSFLPFLQLLKHAQFFAFWGTLHLAASSAWDTVLLTRLLILHVSDQVISSQRFSLIKKCFSDLIKVFTLSRVESLAHSLYLFY